MSPLPNPVANKIIFKQSWSPMDPDAAAYISAVETADGQELEEKVKIAIDNFVLGCKADGIWSAIKASCILAGARTLSGALVPLVGTAPTSYNFVSGDYDRETGLKGDGSTKYLDSNRAGNADPTSDFHLSTYQTEVFTTGIGILGQDAGASRSVIYTSGTSARSSSPQLLTTAVTGFLGVSRYSSTEYTARLSGSNTVVIESAIAPGASNTLVFARTSGGYVDSRLAFYSIGESINLTLLDARVTDLINAFSSVIP
jgi:hypothetical protein